MKRFVLPLVILMGCSSAPSRPDFLNAPTLDQRVTSIEFLSDEEVSTRLTDLERVLMQSPEPRVRRQVILRLQAWARAGALPILRRAYRLDPDPEIAHRALRSLSFLCFGVHGPLRPDRPPPADLLPDCAPAYDGTISLPKFRPAPRLEAADFWRAEDIAVAPLRSGELWPVKELDRARVFAKYPSPVETVPRMKPLGQ